MKNKNSKQMWIYASVLFIVALALIMITTIFQWKLVPEHGNLQVLDSFTQTSNERIDQLTNETVELKNQLNNVQSETEALKNENHNLKTQLDAQTGEKAYLEASNKKIYSLLNAYFADDEKAVKEQLSNFSKEELEAILPGFYDMANKL